MKREFMIHSKIHPRIVRLFAQSRMIATLACLLAAIAATTALSGGKEFTHRIMYLQGGMNKRGIDSTMARMRSAKKLGYNGFVPVCHEYENLQSPLNNFRNNVKKVVAEAKKLDMGLIAWGFHQGQGIYGPGNDLSRGETFPVRNTRFLVAGKIARGAGDHPTDFKNGGFEMSNGAAPAHWTLLNMKAGVTCVIDKTYKKEGTASLKMVNKEFQARIRQNIKLKPFRAYRISAWIATGGIKGTQYFGVKFTVEGHMASNGEKNVLLGRRERPFSGTLDWTKVSGTQGWSKVETDFNSLYSTSATLEFWSNQSKTPSGTVWIDDIKLEEVGLYETVRRRNCPITVRSQDGTATYKEGTDYVVDPKCDTFTDSSYFYEGHLKIPAGSAIKNGQELRVDWYQHADVETVVPDGNFCRPETWAAFRDNIQRTDELLGHNNWIWMGMNEWRVAFWDDNCELIKANTAGEYMGKSLGMAQRLLWSENGCRDIFTWNDMFDPYFNAWKPYCVTHKGALNSWKNLHDSTIIINWRPYDPWERLSIRFFMGVDDSLNPEGKITRQILTASTYSMATKRLSHVAEAEREGGKGVIGMAFVEWYDFYSQLGAVANACKAFGRWGTSPLPAKTCAPCKGCTSSVTLQDPVSLERRTGPGMTVVQKGHTRTLRFHTSQPGTIELMAYDINGRKTRTIARKRTMAGIHEVAWNTDQLSTGVYFVRLSVDGVGREVIKQVVY